MSYGGVPIDLLLESASKNGKYIQLQLPLDLAPEYILPVSYFSDIQVGYEHISHNSLTVCKTTQSVDHPGFAKLRDELELGGYIITARNYSNGDRVLKRFRLNKKWFNSGDKFSCAVAMKYKLENKNV